MAVMEASFDPHFREAWTRKQVEDSLAFPANYYLLIDETGAALGPGEQAAGFVLARQAADETELLLIAVLPEHRGKGLGRKLLDHFIESARQRQSRRVFLEMRQNNPAEKLYRSTGFEPIGCRKNYYRTVTGAFLDAHTFARDT